MPLSSEGLHQSVGVVHGRLHGSNHRRIAGRRFFCAGRRIGAVGCTTCWRTWCIRPPRVRSRISCSRIRLGHLGSLARPLRRPLITTCIRCCVSCCHRSSRPNQLGPRHLPSDDPDQQAGSEHESNPPAGCSAQRSRYPVPPLGQPPFAHRTNPVLAPPSRGPSRSDGPAAIRGPASPLAPLALGSRATMTLHPCRNRLYWRRFLCGLLPWREQFSIRQLTVFLFGFIPHRLLSQGAVPCVVPLRCDLVVIAVRRLGIESLKRVSGRHGVRVEQRCDGGAGVPPISHERTIGILQHIVEPPSIRELRGEGHHPVHTTQIGHCRTPVGPHGKRCRRDGAEHPSLSVERIEQFLEIRARLSAPEPLCRRGGVFLCDPSTAAAAEHDRRLAHKLTVIVLEQPRRGIDAPPCKPREHCVQSRDVVAARDAADTDAPRSIIGTHELLLEHVVASQKRPQATRCTIPWPMLPCPICRLHAASEACDGPHPVGCPQCTGHTAHVRGVSIPPHPRSTLKQCLM